jgi:hypothetical protein
VRKTIRFSNLFRSKTRGLARALTTQAVKAVAIHDAKQNLGAGGAHSAAPTRIDFNRPPGGDAICHRTSTELLKTFRNNRD